MSTECPNCAPLIAEMGDRNKQNEALMRQLNKLTEENERLKNEMQGKVRTQLELEVVKTQHLLLTEQLKICKEALERQTHPHLEQFCKERAREALEKVKELEEK